MKFWILTKFKALLGGGSSYIFLGLGAAFLFQYWQAEQLREKQNELEAQLEEAVAIAREKDTVIATQSRQFNRQISTQKDQENAETLIQSVPDSYHCAQSAPVGSALDWVRDHENGSAQTVHDSANVPVPD